MPDASMRLVARGDEQPEHVPEHERDGCEELERSAHVTVLGEVMEHVRGVVEDGGAGEGDHAHAEVGAELEAEEESGSDQYERTNPDPLQDAAEKREVLARPEGDAGE